MKDVFEVLEPPPNGLTRLRAAMNEERKRRVMWPVLVSAAVAAVLIFVRLEPPNELVNEFTERSRSDQPVMARGDSAVEALPSSSPNVVIYRVTSW
ncbi:MAG: hypothetical protein ACO1OB_14960 [Archangium sp.]